jgi:hypothetical protein
VRILLVNAPFPTHLPGVPCYERVLRHYSAVELRRSSQSIPFGHGTQVRIRVQAHVPGQRPACRANGPGAGPTARVPGQRPRCRANGPGAGPTAQVPGRRPVCQGGNPCVSASDRRTSAETAYGQRRPQAAHTLRAPHTSYNPCAASTPSAPERQPVRQHQRPCTGYEAHPPHAHSRPTHTRWRRHTLPGGHTQTPDTTHQLELVCHIRTPCARAGSCVSTPRPACQNNNPCASTTTRALDATTRAPAPQPARSMPQPARSMPQPVRRHHDPCARCHAPCASTTTRAPAPQTRLPAPGRRPRGPPATASTSGQRLPAARMPSRARANTRSN